jgi:Uma2 family endonuclease
MRTRRRVRKKPRKTVAERAYSPLPMTFEDAARLDPDRDPGEVAAGEWIPMSRNTWRHAEILINVGALLKEWARRSPGWRVGGGDPGAKLTRDPDTLRGPDVAVIREERRPTGRGVEGWLEGAPDLAVEVQGDDQPQSAVLRKAQEYLAAGALMVWVVEPATRQVMVVTPPDRFVVLEAEETLDGGDALPGFSCRVSEFFD